MIVKGDRNEGSLQARIRKLEGKLRNAYNNIQYLKEEPGLSSEDWKSNSPHIELCTWPRRTTGGLRVHLNCWE